MSAGFEIRRAVPGDGDALARIYNHYIRETVITFETEEVTGADMDARVAKLAGVGLPWLLAVDRDVRGGDGVLGYAYAGPFKERDAWRHCLETSVYLDADERGRGLGTALFAELFEALRSLDPEASRHAPVHVLIGGIALPNDASVALHERFGMTSVGVVTEGGRKFDQWVDVGYWQLLLDEDAS